MSCKHEHLQNQNQKHSKKIEKLNMSVGVSCLVEELAKYVETEGTYIKS